MSTIMRTEVLETLTCGNCGILFAVPKQWLDERRVHGSQGGEFVCPNGHHRVFGESELAKVRKQLVQEQSRANTLQVERDVATKQRDRLKKRASVGVCPCCKRTFKQLAQHMQYKHSGFVSKPNKGS